MPGRWRPVNQGAPPPVRWPGECRRPAGISSSARRRSLRRTAERPPPWRAPRAIAPQGDCSARTSVAEGSASTASGISRNTCSPSALQRLPACQEGLRKFGNAESSCGRQAGASTPMTCSQLSMNSNDRIARESFDDCFFDIRFAAAYADRARQGLQHVLLRCQWREVDEPDSARVPLSMQFDHANGDAGLAHAARTGHGHQPAKCQQAEYALYLDLAADKLRQAERARRPTASATSSGARWVQSRPTGHVRGGPSRRSCSRATARSRSIPDCPRCRRACQGPFAGSTCERERWLRRPPHPTRPRQATLPCR